MNRLTLVALLVPCITGSTLAQGIRDTTPTPLYRPGNPFLPPLATYGTQAAWPGMMAPAQSWVGPAWGGGYGGLYPYYGGYYSTPYYWGWGMGAPYRDVPTPIPELQGAGGSGGTQVVVTPNLPAELTLSFPADADVTLNGEAVPGSGTTRTLTSPQMTAGGKYTFNVKANWTTNGQKYEWERVVTLGSGERSQVAIARGFPVKD